MNKGEAVEVKFKRITKDSDSKTNTVVPVEAPFVLYVNRYEVVTLMCTPDKLDYLVTGFLFSEGIISSLDEIQSIDVCEKEMLAMVMLNKSWSPPEKRIATSGCGGGVSFWEDIKVDPVKSDFSISFSEVLNLIKELNRKSELYRLSGGVHSTALSDGKSIILLAEDIGRHNTVDKVLGECLIKNISTTETALLTTGRISSEIVIKAARAKIPIIISMKSPTSLGIEVADKLGITLIARVRGKKISVYTHMDRVQP